MFHKLAGGFLVELNISTESMKEPTLTKALFKTCQGCHTSVTFNTAHVMILSIYAIMFSNIISEVSEMSLK